MATSAEPAFPAFSAFPAFPAFRATTGELVRNAATRYGDKTFIVLGEQRVTFADVERRSALLARGLLASGVGKGTRVGLLAPNGPAWAVAWLAASRIGAVVVLLNTYYRERELSWTVRHGDVQVLLTVDRHLGHDYLSRLEGVVDGLPDAAAEAIVSPSHPYLRSVWTLGSSTRPWARPVSELEARAASVPAAILDEVESEVTPADAAVIVYSSGSAADPKGAVHSQGTVVRHAHNLWPFRTLSSDDVVYTAMPLFWVGGLSYVLVAALHAGATIVFDERFEPGDVLDLIEREGVTQVMGWDHVLNALAEHPSLPQRDLSSLRPGTPFAITPEAREAKEREVHATSLGMTETFGPHTIEDYRLLLPPEKAGSFGRPVPGMEHRVVDPVSGEEVPPGTMGELWVRGYSLMLDLYKKERTDVFTADSWYRTGDAGYFDADGHFFFVGRMGDQIKSSGMNVTPREVELALESYPDVGLAFVAGVPHPERGEDVVAAVVPSPGCQLDGDELRQRLAAELSSYKVPRHVEVFADRTDLPMLDSGKLDLRRLKALLAERYERARRSNVTGAEASSSPRR